MKTVAEVSARFLRKYANLEDDSFQDPDDYVPESEEPIPATVKESNLEVLRTQTTRALHALNEAERKLRALGEAAKERFDPATCPIKDSYDCSSNSQVLVGIGTYQWDCPFCGTTHSG
jgi:hypothetical protein